MSPGTDLSPVQSNVGPPNVRFDIDDCCSAWTYPPNSFDFIHVRSMLGSVEDWTTFYKECMSHLKPGGYIEQAEFSVIAKSDDDTLSPGSALDEWGKFSVRAGEISGRSFQVGEQMQDWIKEAGFVDVVEQRYKWPIGSWSSDPKLKELGRWNLVHWEEGMEGWMIANATRIFKWTYEDSQEYLAKMREALRSRKYHAYHEVGVVYARKPL
ncbi:MAG: hypothetical protein M1819_005491 [Sarea resinae]|nr:MAG: hypothetical protein M1819_005491 [Sarea resinae]